MKRSASLEKLVSRPSTAHSSVTLFELAEPEPADLESPVRRSKRAKPAVAKYEEESEVEFETDFKKRRAVKRTASPLKIKTSATASPSNSPTKEKRTGSPRKPKLVPQALEIPHPAPENWRAVYDKIKAMRSKIIAPVDTMGAGAAQLGETEPRNQRFATLISLMLSSQTKDEVTSAAVNRLRESLGGSISVDAVIAADDKTISDAICKVGFWRRKTEYIKRTAQKLRDDFDSDVPKTVDELCSLPGVGPKMAFLTLHVAWKVNAGIGVDVHVHRITNRLGWHTPPTKTPEETRLNLQSWVPEELRPTFTGLFVGFGQVICLPVGPRCDACELSSGLCPSARMTNVKSKQESSSAQAGPKNEIKLEDDDDFKT